MQQRSGCSRCTRRALARSSEMEMAAVSSIIRVDDATAFSSFTASLSFFISPLGILLPQRRELRLTPLRAISRRSSSCTAGISQEKHRVVFFKSNTMCSMMFIMKEVLPMDGRAAITNNSPGFRPFTLRSSRGNPVVIPRTVSPPFMMRSKLVTASLSVEEKSHESSRAAEVRIFITSCSVSSRMWSISASLV